MIAWAMFAGRSGRGRIVHAFDSTRRVSTGWNQALCGKWAKDAMLDKSPPKEARRCRECKAIEGDTGRFSKWGAGR